MFGKKQKRVRFWKVAKRFVELSNAADKLITQGTDKILSDDPSERAEAVAALREAARLNTEACEVLQYGRA